MKVDASKIFHERHWWYSAMRSGCKGIDNQTGLINDCNWIRQQQGRFLSIYNVEWIYLCFNWIFFSIDWFKFTLNKEIKNSWLGGAQFSFIIYKKTFFFQLGELSISFWLSNLCDKNQSNLIVISIVFSIRNLIYTCLLLKPQDWEIVFS